MKTTMRSLVRTAALSLLLGAPLFASGVAVDEGFENWFKSSPKAYNECYSFSGLPKDVQGTYLIGAIGQFEMGDKKFTGLLDGFGKWHRFVLDGAAGKVCVAAQMINSTFYQNSLAKNTIAPGLLFDETEPPRKCPLLQPMCNLNVPNDNVFVVPLVLGEAQGKQFTATTDATMIFDYDMDNLGMPPKPHEWTDGLCKNMPGSKKCIASTMHAMHMQAIGSAHVLPWNGGYVGLFGDVPMITGTTYVTIYKIGTDGGKRESLASLPLDETVYFHSFGVTDDFAVLPVQPLKFRMGQMYMGKPMSKIFADSARQAQICLLPLTAAGKSKLNGKDYKCIIAPKFYFIHAVNAYQTDAEVVIDLCSGADGNMIASPMATLSFMANKTARDSNPMRGGVHRFSISLDHKNSLSMKELSPAGVLVDMPRVNPHFVGKPYCVFFALEFWHGPQGAGHVYAEMAVYRQNVCTGQRTYFARPALFPSEPFMIPTSETDEEEGIVVFAALDGAKNSSSFFVLDAKTMTELGDITLPARVPFTIHGDWFPGWTSKQEAPSDIGMMLV